MRSEFSQAFELAERGEWARIDEFETLGLGPAVKLKSLHVYFPDEVLPVYSTAHLRHFLLSLGSPLGGGERVVGGGAESVLACVPAARTCGGGLEH